MSNGHASVTGRDVRPVAPLHRLSFRGLASAGQTPAGASRRRSCRQRTPARRGRPPKREPGRRRHPRPHPRRGRGPVLQTRLLRRHHPRGGARGGRRYGAGALLLRRQARPVRRRLPAPRRDLEQRAGRRPSTATTREHRRGHDAGGPDRGLSAAALPVVEKGGPGWKHYSALVAQTNANPTFGGETMARYFDPAIRRLIDLIKRVLPEARDGRPLLGLSQPLGRPDPDAGRDRPAGPPVGRAVPVGRSGDGVRRHGPVRRGRFPGGLRQALSPA